MAELILSAEEIRAVLHILKKTKIMVYLSDMKVKEVIRVLQKDIKTIKESGGDRYRVLRLEEAEKLLECFELNK